MKVLTEADLRSHKFRPGEKEYRIPGGTFVTPTAKEYLRERGIALTEGAGKADLTPENVKRYTAGNAARPVVKDPSAAGGGTGAYAAMTRTPIDRNAKTPYVDHLTGEGLAEKPEDMTHLRGNRLVKKTHPRIAFRGKLDGLQAKILLLEADLADQPELMKDVDGLLVYVQKILGAEVRGVRTEEITLFGLSHRELREMSHNVKKHFGIDHPVPCASMGKTALTLNLLRTEVREAELFAARAFEEEDDDLGIIEHLNRLSSGVYILFCRVLTGYYKSFKEEKT